MSMGDHEGSMLSATMPRVARAARRATRAFSILGHLGFVLISGRPGREPRVWQGV